MHAKGCSRLAFSRRLSPRGPVRSWPRRSRLRAAPSLAGGWTRNADLSDAPPARGAAGRRRRPARRRRQRRRRRASRRRRRRRWIRRRRIRPRRRHGARRRRRRRAMNPEEMARMRDAMRDVTNPSDHLIITQSEIDGRADRRRRPHDAALAPTARRSRTTTPRSSARRSGTAASWSARSAASARER